MADLEDEDFSNIFTDSTTEESSGSVTTSTSEENNVETMEPLQLADLVDLRNNDQFFFDTVRFWLLRNIEKIL